MTVACLDCAGIITGMHLGHGGHYCKTCRPCRYCIEYDARIQQAIEACRRRGTDRNE